MHEPLRGEIVWVRTLQGCWTRHAILDDGWHTTCGLGVTDPIRGVPGPRARRATCLRCLPYVHTLAFRADVAS